MDGLLHLHRSPHHDLARAVVQIFDRMYLAVHCIAFTTFEWQSPQIPAGIVEFRQICGEKLRLFATSPAFGNDEHVVAGRLGQGVDGRGHQMDMEHTMNIINMKFKPA